MNTYYSCSNATILSDTEAAWVSKNKNKVTVALFPYYKPYQFVDDNQKVDGVLIDYLDLLEQKTGLNFIKKRYANWEELLNDARSNKIDLILEIQETSNRKNYLNFYSKLFTSDYVIVTKKDNIVVRLTDLQNKSVVVPKDYGIYEILKEKEKRINITTALDDITCLHKVSTGEHFAYIGPKAVANYLIKSENLENLSITAKTKYTYTPSVAVQKNQKMLNQIIDKATGSILDKEKQTIIDNWLYHTFVPLYKQARFWVALSTVILSLMIIVLLLNRYLKFLVKQKTKELMIAKDKAEESNRLKTAFIHNISHEVRTPMNGIIGFSELINDPETPKEDYEEYAKIIASSGYQLINIIDDIIEISQLQTNQIIVQEEEVNFNELLQQLNDLYKDKALEKDIVFRIRNTIPSQHGFIFADRAKIYKILQRLIDNAIKFTHKGLVEITTKIKDDFLMVMIKDSGIGIKKEDQDLIFNDFSQSEKEVTKSYDGLGLGLSIAQKYAAYLNGKISFISRPNIGSTFTLCIPYHPVIHAQIYADPTNSITSEAINNDLKQVILIAEDGNTNFIYLKTILLKMKGYKFVIYRAENGKKAVELCKNNPNIDLVLMDIRMPIMDGYAATKKIKKIRPGLPVVAQTAYSTEEDIRKALASGCDDLIAKPIDKRLLKPILQKYTTSAKFKKSKTI
ncbi:transporter substrate-binding domain-containing protein [Aquimarina sp. U1-2]|uniref:hybrid sensor histidine kinase/response regulator n=1 Tax=Aquimarina sp. U1-2 TaxID=2823141 RepID=UPI001AECCF78|nr:transporter substrate-binding domain-containing protein [Aquimarina sp. U1-2]